jgi:hypothetical protein
MGPFGSKGVLAAALTGLFAASALASPLCNRLLSLVPAGAAIVAGFDNHGGSTPRGHLLLSTRNNRLDLEDFQALAGVDSKRSYDEVVEVAMATPQGALSEHMLLVAGRFDRERIFRSLEENGAKRVEFLGQKILLIKPFARERKDMVDTRWLAILDNRTVLLGTPGLVQQGLRRHADHAVPDSVLEGRLSLLRPDVNSWNVMVESPKRATRIDFALPHSNWAQLQQDADVPMVAARFGSKICVDFSIHADAAHGSEFFARKADVFTDALAEAQADAKTTEPAQRRLANFVLESNRVQGSVEMSIRQFEAWCQHLYLVRAAARAAELTGN